MWETAGLIEFLSFRELQAIERSYVNGFSLQLQCHHCVGKKQLPSDVTAQSLLLSLMEKGPAVGFL
jgi:hypothetical protein